MDLPGLASLGQIRPFEISTSPFLILDDARDDGAAVALCNPSTILAGYTTNDVTECLKQARALIARGHYVAGYLAYEAGSAFETRLSSIPLPSQGPLIWLASFQTITRLPDIRAVLPRPIELGRMPNCDWDEPTYIRAVEAVLERVRAGDIYQANLTFPTRATIPGSIAAVYSAIRDRQKAGWGGLLWTGNQWLASCSPEMFFSLANGTLEARPMKGTATRFLDPVQDRAEAERLRNCQKERAENLMIVDLIRNDFSRISQPGTVNVPDLFVVETYPTVHQMVSRITARIADNQDAVDVLEAAFPCGSVTGTPKIRAMEVIADVEAGPRGAYTGSLGLFLPDGSAAFNVLIRTLSQFDTDSCATLHVGSGITAGSRPAFEWAECMDKLRFAAGKHEIVADKR